MFIFGESYKEIFSISLINTKYN